MRSKAQKVPGEASFGSVAMKVLGVPNAWFWLRRSRGCDECSMCAHECLEVQGLFKLWRSEHYRRLARLSRTAREEASTSKASKPRDCHAIPLFIYIDRRAN